MKARIYLYHSDPEFRGFIVPDIKSLCDKLSTVGDGRAFVHVGFNWLDTATVSNVIENMPSGVYCSGTFLGCNPGDQWAATTPLLNGAQVEQNSSHFLYKTPVFERHVPDEVEALLVVAEGEKASYIENEAREKIEDRYLASYDWTVRTSNVFKGYEILKLSDLLEWTEETLLGLPNFGRKSLVEVKTYLERRGLKLGSRVELEFSDIEMPDPANIKTVELGNDFYADALLAIAEHCQDRDLTVIKARVGHDSAPSTLQEVGDNLGITRERVRQLEMRVLVKTISRISNKLAAWYFTLEELSARTHYPLNVDAIAGQDPRFTQDRRTAQMVKLLVRAYNRHGTPPAEKRIDVVPFGEGSFISKISPEEVGALETFIENRLINSPNSKEKDIRETILQYIPSNQTQFFELIWTKLWSRSLTAELDGDLILIKYIKSSNAERVTELIIREIDEAGKPLSNSEIESIYNRLKPAVSFRSCNRLMALDDRVFPSSHGYWTTLRSLDLTDANLAVIKSGVRHISSEGRLEFHTRELIPQIEKVSMKNLDEFELTGILRAKTDLQYLGRNVFATLDSSVDGRTMIHDVFVKILKSENRPLHARELHELARPYRSIDPNMQIITKPPIVALGQNKFGLDFWDNPNDQDRP